jgi:hypothetical protein
VSGNTEIDRCIHCTLEIKITASPEQETDSLVRVDSHLVYSQFLQPWKLNCARIAESVSAGLCVSERNNVKILMYEQNKFFLTKSSTFITKIAARMLLCARF